MTARVLAPFLSATAALSAGCNAQTPAAAYVTDSSAEARIVQSLIEFAEARNDRRAASLIEHGAPIIVQADSPHNLNADTIRRYVLPRLTNCGARIIRRTYATDRQVGIDVVCENPPPRAHLEGRDISFRLRDGKIFGANTNDGQAVQGNVNG